MEISYRFVRNPAKGFIRISLLRIKYRGVSVPAKGEMEISYSFIHNSRICELTFSHLRTN